MASAAPRRRGEPAAGGPGWGNVLADAAVLVVVVGLGVWVAEATDWQGSRSFRALFFGVILLGLVGGYAGMLVWNAAHPDHRGHHHLAPRHSRHPRRSRRRDRTHGGG